MIESADIRNFRSLENVQLAGFKRINLLVGDNGAGKTSLLEALFTATGMSAEIAQRLRFWRGLQSPATGNANDIFAALFDTLFHNFDTKRTISVALTGTYFDTRTVRIFFDYGTQISLPLSENPTVVQVARAPIVFEYQMPNSKPERSVAQIQANGLVMSPTTPRPTDSSYFSPRQPISLQENAAWFSALSIKNKEQKFIEVMQDQFPEIEAITIEAELTLPSVFVRTKWRDRKIPIGLASDGMTKFLAVLLHIAHAEKSATFIDELEDGIHFSRYGKLWRQVVDMTSEYQSQLFASTHSFEFIKAAVPMIEEHPDEFALIRVYQKNGIGNAVVLSGKEALSLIEAGLEVRG